MGQGSSTGNPLRENLESLHNQLMKHAGADYDIATTTTLTYDQFLSYITQLNQICREYKDSDGHVLVFAVKKGTDSTIFWKATVRIACVKLNTVTNKVLSYRLLNIRQFLQVFRRITYECTGGSLGGVEGLEATNVCVDDRGAIPSNVPVPPTMAASMVLGRMQELSTSSRTHLNQPGIESHGATGTCGTNLEECVICLERRPDVILPCAHAYCLPCIEQWTDVDKTCPVCRESLKSTDDTWVLSEVPDDDQVNDEIRRALIGLAGDKTESPP
ncbi:RING finger protein 141-like isoform X2 [Palaemon carinicauda]|uniref:RING finger protein 141-like isoform X2 n=1 Tax=Palaemon carinicauda TaxID=392227 RepID=UPI0035B57326